MKLVLAGQLGPRVREAYTITEVVVAVLVLGIMLVSLYAGFSEGFAFVQTAREDLRATQILVQKAEALRIINWYDLVTQSSITFQQRYDPLSTSTNSQGALYYGSVATAIPTNIPDAAIYKTNMRLVTISLNWTNFNGTHAVAHTREMQTFVSRYGMQNYVWGLW